MNSKILFLLLAISATVISQCIVICSNIFTDQLSCQGPNSDACNCQVYEKDVPLCVSCQLAAGVSPADVAVYTSLLATCPGGMAYLSTILSPNPTTYSTTTTAHSILTTTHSTTTTPSPAKTAASTTTLAASTSPIVSVSQATVTLVSGERKVQASTVAVLILVMVVAIVG